MSQISTLTRRICVTSFMNGPKGLFISNVMQLVEKAKKHVYIDLIKAVSKVEY